MSRKRRGPPFTTNTAVETKAGLNWPTVDLWLREQGCGCRIGVNYFYSMGSQAPRLLDYGPTMRLSSEVCVARLEAISSRRWMTDEDRAQTRVRFLFKDRPSALLFKLALGGSI
jgi:hypothetical protein